jgi:hypothetical protein
MYGGAEIDQFYPEYVGKDSVYAQADTDVLRYKHPYDLTFTLPMSGRYAG